MALAERSTAQWVYEAGIGEERAALIADGHILEARIEATDRPIRAGAIVKARIASIEAGKRAAVARLEAGEQLLIDPLPPGIAEGATVAVEISRPALPESFRKKAARGRIVERAPRPAPDLKAQLGHSDHPIRETGAHERDWLESAGWSQVIAEAASGAVAFPGGALEIALTSAMTVIDVDGVLPPAELAIAGATAAAEAMVRLDIGGATVIDLPSLENRKARQAAAEAVDSVIPPPFERTAVNGFGLLQIVRPRTRLSLLEMARFEAPSLAARLLLRTAERARGHGMRTLTAHPSVTAILEGRSDWLETLGRRTGAEVSVRPDTGLDLWAGHVACETPG